MIVNPPYIPLEAFESVVPEARDHDPLIALFAGADGLDAIKVVAGEAAADRPAGIVCISTLICKESAQPILVQHGAFAGVRDHRTCWATALCHSRPGCSVPVIERRNGRAITVKLVILSPASSTIQFWQD